MEHATRHDDGGEQVTAGGGPDGASGADPRGVALLALTTVAWYAVPDVARTRGVRALLKTTVLAAGGALALAVTREGAQMREGVADLRETLRAVRDGVEPGREGGTDVVGRAGTGTHSADDTHGTDDNRLADDRVLADLLDDADGTDPDARRLPPALAAVLGVAGLAAGTALTVAGERWVYRRGERLRARGVRLPHTRVGLVMGVLAAGIGLAEPRVWRALGVDPATGGRTPDRATAGRG